MWPMEMDYQPNRFFDDSGQWLMCATHGAAYRPDTGALRAAAPAVAGWSKLPCREHDGVVHWHTGLQPQTR